MALTDENGMVMPVTPMYGGNGGFGGGLFGGDLSILVLFFLFMMMGGWGNGFGGGGSSPRTWGLRTRTRWLTWNAPVHPHARGVCGQNTGPHGELLRFIPTHVGFAPFSGGPPPP